MSKSLKEQWDEACKGASISPVRAGLGQRHGSLSWRRIFTDLQSRIEKNIARGRHVELQIDYPYFLKLVERSGGFCELTSIPFEFCVGTRDQWNPYRPSLDRVDSTKGYVEGNLRLVCLAINIAMHRWGSEVFDHIAQRRWEFLAKGSATHDQQRLDSQAMASFYLTDKRERLQEMFFDSVQSESFYSQRILPPDNNLGALRRSGVLVPPHKTITRKMTAYRLYRVGDVVAWSIKNGLHFDLAYGLKQFIATTQSTSGSLAL